MIAIIGAMEQEVEALRQRMRRVERKTISKVSISSGILADHEVILMKSGVGKGEAAMATTILLEHFPISAIINIGTAGGLHEAQQVLDVVISKQVVQHDFDTTAIDGESGKGLYFNADAHLIALCEETIASGAYQTWVGQVASGDRFVAGKDCLQSLLQAYPQAMCAEMEAGAIAQVAAHYQIPFVVIRSLSDVAANPDSHMDFPVYVEQASKRSAAFCEAIVAQL